METLEQTNLSIECRYRNAQKLLKGYLSKEAAINTSLYPNWIGETDCFWYTKDLGENRKEFRLVNADANKDEWAFDHRRLAERLADAAESEVEAYQLPIAGVEIDLDPCVVRFTAFNKRWEYDAVQDYCQEIPSLPGPQEVVSPNGQYMVFCKSHNLWLRDLQSGEERALTTDGSEDNAYGEPSSAWGFAHAIDLQVKWSPDSQRVFTVQRDRRNVASLPIVHHVPLDGSNRPQVTFHKVAYPGDEEVETLRLLTIDINSATQQAFDYPQIPVTRNSWGFFTASLGWWHQDSQRAYFVHVDRFYKYAKVIECDTQTGETKELFEERSDTNVCLMNNGDMWPYFMPLTESNELLWYSERSGWAHLYLYDLNNGQLKNVVTQGDWMVRDVITVVPDRREVFVQTASRASERSPYYRDIARVDIDTGELSTLASGNYDYFASAYTEMIGVPSGINRFIPEGRGVSPTGNYAVVTRSRVDTFPEHLVINRCGAEVMELGVAELADMPEGWQLPEPVQLIADDGVTEITGVIYRPSFFSPDQCYPVINDTFSTPDFPWVPLGSFDNSLFDGYAFYCAAALAELGFIVVQIDGRGASFRDKSFRDAGYGNLQLPVMMSDQVAGLKQLSERYSYIDTTRAGVYEHQGGAAVVNSMLDYPQIYKVGVSCSSHDARLMGASMWSDMYEGECKPTTLYAEEKIDNLQGKLLLMNGMADICTPAAGVFRVVEALQNANKSFDLVLLPNLGHEPSGYMFRRGWDYFVLHFLGEEPPKDFSVRLSWDA